MFRIAPQPRKNPERIFSSSLATYVSGVFSSDNTEKLGASSESKPLDKSNQRVAEYETSFGTDSNSGAARSLVSG